MCLESDRDVVAARLVKGRLERTTLGQVAADIAITFKPGALRVARGASCTACMASMQMYTQLC